MSELDKRGELASAAAAAGEIARKALADLAADFRQPEFRAGFGAAMLTTVIMARTRLPFAVVVATSVMVGASVEHFYGMAADIHEKLTGDAPGEV